MKGGGTGVFDKPRFGPVRFQGKTSPAVPEPHLGFLNPIFGHCQAQAVLLTHRFLSYRFIALSTRSEAHTQKVFLLIF